jgi:hypothetical protein
MVHDKVPIFRVELTYVQQVNWSLINAHIPWIFHLGISTNVPVEDASVRISVRTRSAEYAKYERMIPQILPGNPWSVNNLTDRDFTVDFKKAAILSHSVPAILKVELQADKTFYSTSGPLELLAYNEWHPAIEQWQLSNGRKQALSNADLEVYHLHAELPPGGHISPSTIKKALGWRPPFGSRSRKFSVREPSSLQKICGR